MADFASGSCSINSSFRGWSMDWRRYRRSLASYTNCNCRYSFRYMERFGWRDFNDYRFFKHTFFLLRFPLIGGARTPFLIGLTDFLFFAIFYQAAVRFNLGLKKNICLLVASFLIAVASAIFSQTGLPVLPFMAAFFVVGNFRQLDVNRKDIKLIALFIFGMLIAFGLFTNFIAK